MGVSKWVACRHADAATGGLAVAVGVGVGVEIVVFFLVLDPLNAPSCSSMPPPGPQRSLTATSLI